MNAQCISDMPVDIFVFTSAQTQYIVTLSSTLMENWSTQDYIGDTVSIQPNY